MPAETELQIDDGTNISALSLQCTVCEGGVYLERESKEIVGTPPLEVVEYTFTCPTPECATRVVVRVPQNGAS